MFASHGRTPVSANDWGKNTAAVAVLIKFAPYWASLIFLRAMQLEAELFMRSWCSSLTAFCLSEIIEALSQCEGL